MEQENLPLQEAEVGDDYSEIKSAMELLDNPEAAEDSDESVIRNALEAVESETEEPEEEPAEEPAEETEEASEEETEAEGEPKTESLKRIMEMHARLQAKEKAIKEREREIQHRISELEKNQPQSVQEDLARDPIGYLEKHYPGGYKEAFKHWTQHKLGQKPEVPSFDGAKKEEKFDPKQIEETIAKRVQQEIQQYQQQAEANRWINEAQSVVSSEEYEPIRLLGADDEVTQLAIMHLRETGEMLTPKQAADMILAEANKRIEKIYNIKASTGQKTIQQPVVRSSKANKTIKNNMDATTMSVKPDDDVADDRTEIRKALALLNI